jgi:hypothetical protein
MFFRSLSNLGGIVAKMSNYKNLQLVFFSWISPDLSNTKANFTQDRLENSDKHMYFHKHTVKT